jgi:D-alanyl-D-alanine carboxypeptidase
VLTDAAGADGMTATLMTPGGSWSGAAGTADGTRAMEPAAQMAIGSITKSIVATQVMRLVDAGELSLDDAAADRLPPKLAFDTNGATIGQLLAMRSGIPDYVDALWKSLKTDRLHAWTTDQVLALVGTDRVPAGAINRYSSTDYVVLGLILEHVTGRPLGEVLRSGVLSGDGMERLIYQPDERPTEPIAMPNGAHETLGGLGGSIPSLAATTAAGAAGSMASDSATLARWWARLCGGRMVTPPSLDAMTNFDDGDGYGLGLFDMTDAHGTSAVGNGGVQVGYAAYAACVVESRSVVVVLSNGGSLDAVIRTADALVASAGRSDAAAAGG